MLFDLKLRFFFVLFSFFVFFLEVKHMREIKKGQKNGKRSFLEGNRPGIEEIVQEARGGLNKCKWTDVGEAGYRRLLKGRD